MWLLALRTPLLPIAAAIVVLGWVERSRALALAGAWLGLVAWWQHRFGMGRTGPIAWLLAGGHGGGHGGAGGAEIDRLGLNRPGPVLILATLPLVVFAVVRAVRCRGGAR
jgi:hypothetical protein